MAANPQNTAGRDDEPVDFLAVGIHQRGRDVTDLAVIAAINARPLDLGDVFLVQRIHRCFFVHGRGRGARGRPRRTARRVRHLRRSGAGHQRECRDRYRKLTHGTTPMLMSAFLPTRRIRSRFRRGHITLTRCHASPLM